METIKQLSETPLLFIKEYYGKLKSFIVKQYFYNYVNTFRVWKVTVIFWCTVWGKCINQSLEKTSTHMYLFVCKSTKCL